MGMPEALIDLVLVWIFIRISSLVIAVSLVLKMDNLSAF